MKVLAAIDNSAAAWPVLRAAQIMGRLTGAEPEALHVQEDGGATATGAAAALGIPLVVADGSPITAIVAALAPTDVVLGVLGARRDVGGRHPAGHTAMAVIGRVDKPLLIVPPEAALTDPGRVLVPLDGTRATAVALEEAVGLLAGAGLDVVVLHVFDTHTVPSFWDRPHYNSDVWGREFLARYCREPGARLELRAGATGGHVLRVAEAEQADLVALAWSQDLSGGHAQIIREVLAGSPIPILLVPTSIPATTPA